ncbi:spore germination protein KB [Paenibacillus catalpae]|uniref:Spore germination protein KB n=1 Tax=Paenibacillus catalpae TaxID=1045775 RepID=A0A1I2BU53_9BACL|nr:endospore germination permease [Paenibacillus catalpae]SFE59642.1 spore germination protein KB [Paenibacillus catalpae]
MLEKERLSSRQLVVLIFMCTVGDMFQLYPSLLASLAHQDAWISSLLGIIGGLFVIACLYAADRIYPDLSLIETCMKVLGVVPGFILSIWYLFYFLMVCSYLVREIGGFLTTQIFMSTPHNVVHLLIILLMLWAMKAGIEAIGRSSEIILPFFLMAAAILVLCVLPQVEFHRLKPVGEHGLLPIIHGMLTGFTFPFCEMSAFLMITPHVNRQPHLSRDVLFVTIAAGLIFSIITTVSLTVLGTNLTAYSTYSMYVLAQKISIGNFLQRIEVLMAITYLITTFFKVVIFFYAFTIGIAQLFKLKQKKPLYFPGGLLIFGLAFVIAPDVLYYLRTIVTPWMYWDLTNGVLIPLFISLVYIVKRKFNKHPVPH